MNDRPVNMGASVYNYVRREAKAKGRDVQHEAQSYAIRCFIARLMEVDTEGRTTIKGGQGLGLVFGNDRRPTKDLDLNIDCDGIADQDAWIRSLINQACAPRDDGVVFNADSIKIETREHQGLGGFRIEIRSSIHTCRTNFVIDVGIGNRMTFKPISLEHMEKHPYALPAAHIRVYPLETTFAEKLLSKVEDGASSIRHKDFYDLWYIHDITTRIGDLGFIFAKSFDLSDETLTWRDMVVAKIKEGTWTDLPRLDIREEALDMFAYALYRSALSRGTELPDDMMAFLRREFGAGTYQSSQFTNWVKNNKQRLTNMPMCEDKNHLLGNILDQIEPFIQTISNQAKWLADHYGNNPPEYGQAFSVPAP
jgi:Uncharacterized conserved protein